VLFELVAYAEFKLDNNVTQIHFKYLISELDILFEVGCLIPWESYVV